MNPSILLADVIARGVTLEAHEAVAIAQQVIDTCMSGFDATPPLGPPAPETVMLASDGSVVCRGCAITPTVSEIAFLMEAMLPRDGKAPVPGGVRYAMARALLEVDALPFDSLGQFSESLKRYERGDRATVLRDLFARAQVQRNAVGRAAAVAHERRRTISAPWELRRSLRERDLEVFEYQTLIARRAEQTGPTVQPRPRRGRRRRAIVLGLAVAALLPAATARFFRLHHQPVESRLAPTRPAFTEARTPHLREAQPANPVPGLATPAASSPMARDARHGAGIDSAARPVRTVGADSDPEFTGASGSNGTAIFSPSGSTTSDTRLQSTAGSLGGDLQVLTIADEGHYHVRPSPDGTRIAFDSDRDGERAVYVANRDGTNVTRVTRDGYAAVPSWAPDGGRLTFIRPEPGAKAWNLWLVSLASGATRRLTHFQGGETWGASWFPDGRRLCYTHVDRLVVLDLETGSAREFATPVPGQRVRTPAVSPDGRLVIFQVHRSGAWLLDLQDGSMRCVLTDPTAEEFAWSPDGRRLAFHSRRDGQWGIWIMRAT